MIRTKFEVEVYIMNLNTYKGDYFKVSSVADCLTAIEKVTNCQHDWEIQLISHDYEGYMPQVEINIILDLIEEYNIDHEDLLPLLCEYSIDDVRFIIENDVPYQIVYADNKKEAFEDYIREHNLIDIPDHLESYIDWDVVLTDWECGGMRVKRVADATIHNSAKYLIINQF